VKFVGFFFSIQPFTQIGMLEITDMKGEIFSLVVSDIWTVYRLVTISFILFHYFSQMIAVRLTIPEVIVLSIDTEPIEMFFYTSFLKMLMKLYYFLQLYL
jgi:hypothetical protein